MDDQVVSYSEFLRLCGAAETVHLVREEDYVRLEGRFNIGGGRTLTLSTRPILLKKHVTDLLPWR